MDRLSAGPSMKSTDPLQGLVTWHQCKGADVVVGVDIVVRCTCIQWLVYPMLLL